MFKMEYPVTRPVMVSAVFLCAASLCFWYRTSRSHLPRDLPERLQRHLQLVDVGVGGGVVRPVVPHGGVVEECARASCCW